MTVRFLPPSGPRDDSAGSPPIDGDDEWAPAESSDGRAGEEPLGETAALDTVAEPKLAVVSSLQARLDAASRVGRGAAATSTAPTPVASPVDAGGASVTTLARDGVPVGSVRGAGGPAEAVAASATTPSTGGLRWNPTATATGGADEEDGVVEPTLEEIEDRVLAKLARKQMSEEETRRALRDEGADDNDAEDMLADFSRKGYVDDAKLAEVLVEKLLDRKKQGPSVIRRELSQRGLPDHVISTALEVLDEDAEQQLVLEAALDRVRRLGSLERSVAERRLTAYLLRRGYASGMVRDAVQKALGPSRRGPGSVSFR